MSEDKIIKEVYEKMYPTQSYEDSVFFHNGAKVARKALRKQTIQHLKDVYKMLRSESYTDNYESLESKWKEANDV